jgi:hypothetical protein
MSIMPAGGWGDPPRPESQPSPSYPQQPAYTPRRSYLTCKVCDSGTLVSKKVFRMSGPVVAIGFIFLIPSVLGMLFSALLFFGFIALPAGGGLGTSDNVARRPFQSDFDASFRKSCAASVKQKNQEVGYYASQQLIEQYCECALSAFKDTGSTESAYQTCFQRAQDGTLEQPSQDVDALYSNNTSHQSRDREATNLVSILGGGFAVVLGISSFVGGLLGWLLVMRKRVLQCDVCGAVVNAS